MLSWRVCSSKQPYGLILRRGYAVKKSKDFLSLPFTSDFFGSRRLNKTKDSEPIEPEIKAKKYKTEETIHKLWASKESANKPVSDSENLKINIPSKYSKLISSKSTLTIESDDEIDQDKFIDPFKSHRMGSIRDEIEVITDLESKNKILDQIKNLPGNANEPVEAIDSDDFDAMLNNSKKENEDEDDLSGKRDSESDDESRKEKKTIIGKRERIYTLHDLIRDDQIRPDINEEFNKVIGDENDEGQEGFSFIEDIDLASYSLQKGNIVEAQQFLQDVAKFKTSDFPMEKRTKIVDMVKKARRILDSHRASREFWDEFLVFRQLHELTTVGAIHYRPVLHPGVKDSIFLLHQSNPEEWTTGKLAQRFRIKKARIEAILLLKIDEHVKRKTTPWEVDMAGDDIDFLYGEYFGITGSEWLGNEDDRFNINERRWRNARVGAIDDEVCFFLFFFSFFYIKILFLFLARRFSCFSSNGCTN